MVKYNYEGVDIMPLFILGLLLVIGLFVYYIVSNSSGFFVSKQNTKKNRNNNVIFLPQDLEKEKAKHKNNHNK